MLGLLTRKISHEVNCTHEGISEVSEETEIDLSSRGNCDKFAERLRRKFDHHLTEEIGASIPAVPDLHFTGNQQSLLSVTWISRDPDLEQRGLH